MAIRFVVARLETTLVPPNIGVLDNSSEKIEAKADEVILVFSKLFAVVIVKLSVELSPFDICG